MRRWWPWTALAILLLAVGGYVLVQHRKVSQAAGSLFVERDKSDDLPPIDPASQPALRSVAPPAATRAGSMAATSPASPASAAPSASGTSAQSSAQATPAQSTPARATPAQASASQAASGLSAPVATSSAPMPGQPDERVRILLIGTDQDALGNTTSTRGRSDVLLLLLLDPKAQALTLLSIPRDLRLDIPGDGVHKVNAAYNYGGASLTARTLEIYLGVPFDYYVEISQGGFSRLVTAVGGVQVQVPFDFNLDGSSFVKGPQQLSGPDALAYVRMRKDDPAGDLGREARQQEVIKLLLSKLAGLSPTQLTPMLRSLQGNLRTDLTPSEVLALERDHAYALDPAHQHRLTVEGSSQQIDGIWYYVVSDAERRKLYLTLR